MKGEHRSRRREWSGDQTTTLLSPTQTLSPCPSLFSGLTSTPIPLFRPPTALLSLFHCPLECQLRVNCTELSFYFLMETGFPKNAACPSPAPNRAPVWGPAEQSFILQYQEPVSSKELFHLYTLTPDRFIHS